MHPKSSPASRFIPLGKILQEWGLRGQVRVLSFNPDSELYPTLSELFMEGAPDESRGLESAKRHGRYWLFKLKGYETPEQARELRGKVFGLPRDRLPPPGEGEVYLSDMEGLPVFSANGRLIGEVVGFLPVGDGEVLRIARPDLEEALIPYRPEFVRETSLDNDALRLTELAEGLL